MIQAELTNDLGSLVLPKLEVPLTQGTIENATDVETLDGNIYTDFIRQKRQWTISYSYMSESEYNSVRAYYDQQFVDFKYPLLSIDFYTISNLPVRMYMNDKNIINNCADVRDVVLTFRESRQLP